jgi:hypothetical protein
MDTPDQLQEPAGTATVSPGEAEFNAFCTPLPLHDAALTVAACATAAKESNTPQTMPLVTRNPAPDWPRASTIRSLEFWQTCRSERPFATAVTILLEMSKVDLTSVIPFTVLLMLL